jgi:hypothetical protein
VPYYYPEPYPRVLVTIDEQRWPAVLRAGATSEPGDFKHGSGPKQGVGEAGREN